MVNSSIAVRFCEVQFAQAPAIVERRFQQFRELGWSPQRVADELAASAERTMCKIGLPPDCSAERLSDVCLSFRAGEANQYIAGLLGYV